MRRFMDEDFMLYNDTAKRLYHRYAQTLPIFDYHCHLSAREIYENRPADNIAQLWLGGDHYKWRAMRANGISEERITGSASDYEKFEAYAETLPYAAGNPLYHWSHLELQRYFHIDKVLGPSTCREIWEEANAAIQSGGFTPRRLIMSSNVYGMCTTEDPADSLEYHRKLAEEGFPVKVLPAMRPDSALEIEKKPWRDYMRKLGSVSGVEIRSFQDLKNALEIRMDAFGASGCVAADHGFERFMWAPVPEAAAEEIFRRAIEGEDLGQEEVDAYKSALMVWLGREYSRRKWAMELHMGPVRSRNTRMVACVGEATGFDSIGDHPLAVPLAAYMDELEKTRQLPKTILFSINNRDNMVLATMAGNFQDSSVPSKIQMGTAWWFQDHRDGMEEQMKNLANEGLLGRFIGMLTDSRSFLSYPRHEYFRRILCNLVGNWVEMGEFPEDETILKKMISDISFYNAKAYFDV